MTCFSIGSLFDFTKYGMQVCTFLYPILISTKAIFSRKGQETRIALVWNYAHHSYPQTLFIAMLFQPDSTEHELFEFWPLWEVGFGDMLSRKGFCHLAIMKRHLPARTAFEGSWILLFLFYLCPFLCESLSVHPCLYPTLWRISWQTFMPLSNTLE